LKYFFLTLSFTKDNTDVSRETGKSDAEKFSTFNFLPFSCDLSHFSCFAGKTIDKKEFVAEKRDFLAVF